MRVALCKTSSKSKTNKPHDPSEGWWPFMLASWQENKQSFQFTGSRVKNFVILNEFLLLEYSYFPHFKKECYHLYITRFQIDPIQICLKCSELHDWREKETEKCTL